MKKCIVIGISDKREQWFPPEVMGIISAGTVFSGGKRHHEIMSRLLPENAVWIDITVPLCDVFARYKDYDNIVIFASGDPLFYGFASTVMRECPYTKMKVYPSFNSLQMLAHHLCLPYQDMKAVSLTGRLWDGFDEALISGEELIGCLTDRNKTPNAIVQRMMVYGYDNYDIYVGENLGNETLERVTVHDCSAVMLQQFAVPNCVILKRKRIRQRPFGIPDSEFFLLDGREKMITKMPIRLLSLSMLDLHGRHSLWDVGFCTGSISIEAKLQFPHLAITAFEIREEGKKLMLQNSRKFGTPGITSVIGDFLEADLDQYPRPDAVFIGGHGGRLHDMMERIYPYLDRGGIIVMNSVTDSSYEMFTSAAEALGMCLSEPMHISLNNYNPITILKATK